MKTRHIALIACLVLAVWLVVGLLPTLIFNTKLKQSDPDAGKIDTATPGTFGDSFGMATSLFNGLALAGVIIAIVLQSKELALQRDELRLTREELKRTADAQQEAQRALEAQARMSFLTTYLQALSATEKPASETKNPSLLLDARARVRTLRARTEVDALLHSLGPELRKLGVDAPSSAPLDSLEKILELAEQLDEVSTVTFALEKEVAQEQQAALLQRIARQLKSVDRQFDIVLQTADIPVGAHRVISQEYIGFRDWRQYIETLVGGSYSGALTSLTRPASSMSEQIASVALDLAPILRH